MNVCQHRPDKLFRFLCIHLYAAPIGIRGTYREVNNGRQRLDLGRVLAAEIQRADFPQKRGEIIVRLSTERA
jgi:hypothetical protein